MDLEVVTIGAELLLGHTIDTNAADVCRALASAGAFVVRTTTVADQPDAIGDAVAEALRRSRFVITSGGLGPTRDDRTKRVVADLFSVPLDLDGAYLRRLEERWRALGRVGAMPEANRTQAEVPRGAIVLPNPQGTAPGLWLEGEPGTVVMLPGVPHELQGLLADQVAPRIAERTGGGRVTRWRVLRTTGIAESALADRLGDTEPALAPATLAYLPTLHGVDLRLTAWSLPEGDAERVLQRASERVTAAVGEHVYGGEGTDLAAVLVARLADAGQTLAVAESCTGGLVAGRVTAVPGASAVFAGGVIAYADHVKRRDLDVPAPLLSEHGAVSEAVALAMARGAAARFGADAALAVSGIAGPDGGTPDKPVGTVWIAARTGDRERTVRIGLPGGRQEVRERAAQAALDTLRRLLASGGRDASG